MTCTEKTFCRLCGSSALQPALALTPTPPANAFLAKPEPQECFPLEVRVCSDCGHSQLGHVVTGLFDDYAYVSGTSPSFRKHFEEYAAAVSKRVGLDSGDLVVEIGSNDQSCLKNFKARRIGVEPAKNLAEKYATPGITTINSYFDEGLALAIRDGHGPAKLIVANNVMAHIDDLGAVVKGVRQLLDSDGLFVFEVNYVGALLRDGYFDAVYHEHLDYSAVAPLVPFFQRLGLNLFDVEKVPTHGGSIRCYVAHEQHRPHFLPCTPGMRQLLEHENETGLLTPEPWLALRKRIDAQKVELHALLDHLKAQGRSIVGYGAPAKACTLVHELQLAEYLDYICDDADLKQGKFLPGTQVQVLPPSALYEGNTAYPDVVVVLAWNFAPQIIEKCKELRENGTHFITPFPTLTVTP